MSEAAREPRSCAARHVWVGAIIAALVISAWSFAPLLFEGHTLYTGDIRHYHTPMLHAWMDAVSQGHLPLWTEHSYLGFPLIGDPQVATFYPGTPLVAWLGPRAGYLVLSLVHLWIAAGGCFLLARALGGSVAGGVVAALIVSQCGFFAHEIQHPGLLAILAWMPWWWWATVRGYGRPGRGPLLSIALVVAAMLFAGTLQVLLGGLLFYNFFVAGLTFAALREYGPSQALARLALVIAGNLLGLALAAVVIAPAVAHLPLTARALGMTYDFAAMGSLHPNDLMGLVLNGYGAAASSGQDGFDFNAVSFYVGVLTLPLAAVGLLGLDRRLAGCVVVGVAFLLWLGMGRHAGLHPWLFENWPTVFEGFRGMSRALGPVSVLFAVAAGLGVERVASGAGERGGGWALGWLVYFAALAGLVVWVKGEESAALGGSLAVALVGALLLSSASFRELPMRGLLLVVLIAVDLVGLGPLRSVLRENPMAEEADPASDDIAALREIAGPDHDRMLLHGFGPLNLPVRNGVDGVGGYNPLVPLDYLDFVFRANGLGSFPRQPISDFVSGVKPQRFGSKLVDAAAIRHVITTRHDRARRLGAGDTESVGALRDQGAALYANPDAMPRAYLTHRSELAEGLADLDRRLGKSFDPRAVTIVEGDGPALRGDPEVVPVRIERSRPEHKVMTVDRPEPGVLVLVDAFHSGWRATVGGTDAPIFRVNGMFMGVEVPPGPSRVEFVFLPTAFKWGAMISLLALGMAIALGASHLRSLMSEARIS